jgi:hypothetical protein
LQSKKIVREDHYLLFYYDGKGECRYFQIWSFPVPLLADNFWKNEK